MGIASKEIFLDFEFNQVSEPFVNLVSCVIYDKSNDEIRKFWLHNSPSEKAKLSKYLKQFKTVIGYSCVAEARSYLSLGLEPLNFEWIDLFLEYRMLTNHNDDLQWGKQLKDGKIITARKPKPKWERDEGESDNGFRATHSLAEATFKLTGKIRDTIEKQEARDLIISNPKSFTASEKNRILEYNAEDVLLLPEIRKRCTEEFKKLCPEYDLKQYEQEAKVRGRYSAHTAHMENLGYPIDYEATKNFSKQVPSILMACQRDINSQFPNNRPFKWDKKHHKYTWNQKLTRKWIEENNNVRDWMRTDKNQLSLALEAFEKFYSFKHDYPRGNFGAQMVRFLKLKQSLYGFSESGGKRKSFWDSVGSDHRVRPYMNIYGAQSGRSQPAATGFMFLKPAWMRSLVVPKQNKFIAGIDYGQQEFFLAGLESEDKTMIQAYLSGDPYMFGAKLAGVIPENGTREEYKKERDLFKNTYLGINFGMTKYGLSIKLTGDTGEEYTEEDAQEQIDLFEEAYEDYIEWKKDYSEKYDEGNSCRLPCGWFMWSDNPNIRSVLNFPIQGFGGSIMRKAVDLAVSRGCKVIFTLHDAIYIEGNVGEEAVIGELYRSMREAFQFYFKGTKFYETSGKIKLDPFAWSPSYEKDSEFEIGIKSDIKPFERIKIPCSNLYVDERATSEYERFKKYFSRPISDLL